MAGDAAKNHVGAVPLYRLLGGVPGRSGRLNISVGKPIGRALRPGFRQVARLRVPPVVVGGPHFRLGKKEDGRGQNAQHEQGQQRDNQRDAALRIPLVV